MYISTPSNLFTDYLGIPMHSSMHLRIFIAGLSTQIFKKSWINLNVHDREIVKETRVVISLTWYTLSCKKKMAENYNVQIRNDLHYFEVEKVKYK